MEENYPVFQQLLDELAVLDLHLECHRTIKGYHRGRRAEHPVDQLNVTIALAFFSLAYATNFYGSAFCGGSTEIGNSKTKNELLIFQNYGRQLKISSFLRCHEVQYCFNIISSVSFLSVFIKCIFDFKGDLFMGKGQVTTSAVDMKKHGKASLFNLTIEYRDSEEEELQRFYVDVSSKKKDHDAFAALCHLRFIVKHIPYARMLFQTRKHVEWSYDCASGNVCHEMTCELLVAFWPTEFPNLVTLSLCPFEQCHGHEICDRHFSTVDETVDLTGPHKTRQDLVDGMNKGRDIIYKRRTKKGLPEIHMVAALNNDIPDIRPPKKKILEIKGISIN